MTSCWRCLQFSAKHQVRYQDEAFSWAKYIIDKTILMLMHIFMQTLDVEEDSKIFIAYFYL